MEYKIGDIIRIIDCPEARRNNGLKGTILYIEDDEFLHGTWSDEIICPFDDCDVIEKIGHEFVSKETTKLVEMGSNQKDAKKLFSRFLKQGVIHLIKLYCYRNWEQIYDFHWSDKWIGTVWRNVAIGNDENEKSYIREVDYDSVVSNYLDNKFNACFKNAQNEVIEEDYPLPILDNDFDGAKEFTKKYLEWAKPKLLQYEQIPKKEVSAKIYELLNEVKN